MRTKPRIKPKQHSVFLPPALLRALRAQAAVEGRTTNGQIVHILAQAVDYHYYQETELIHHG